MKDKLNEEMYEEIMKKIEEMSSEKIKEIVTPVRESTKEK